MNSWGAFFSIVETIGTVNHFFIIMIDSVRKIWPKKQKVLLISIELTNFLLNQCNEISKSVDYKIV